MGPHLRPGPVGARLNEIAGSYPMSRKQSSLRNVNGILPLDKPVGLSSNEALQRVKRLYRARKAGHTGSLDPIASGLLLICMGEATKVSTYLLNADKRYHTMARLGVITTTGDVEGEVVERRPVGEYSEARLEEVLARFRGEIEQIPPMYSALKRNGTRLYELARQGVEVAREPRTVHIHALELLAHDAQTLTLDILCSKGTYIRTLVEDIAEGLGCGAHACALRRTAVGPYTEADMLAMEELEARAQQGFAELDGLLRPMDSALTLWPALKLTRDMAYYARSGQAILVPGAPPMGWVRIYDERDAFLGVGRILDDGRMAPKRLMTAG